MLALVFVLALFPVDPAQLTAHVLIPESELDYSPATLRAYAAHVAEERGLHVGRFVGTLECESGFKHDARGDSGTSLGIAQFRFPETDWGVSEEEVLNPYTAIQLMADAFEDGLAYKWTCWVRLRASS